LRKTAKDMFVDEFLEDRVVDHEYVPWKCFSDVDMEENSDSWGDILASLEQRYTREAPSTSGRGPRREVLESDSTIATTINIMRSPTINDTPLWRVRCKVRLPSMFL